MSDLVPLTPDTLKTMKLGEECRLDSTALAPRFFVVHRVPDGWLYTLCGTDGLGDPFVVNTTYVPELNPWEISNAVK